MPIGIVNNHKLTVYAYLYLYIYLWGGQPKMPSSEADSLCYVVL